MEFGIFFLTMVINVGCCWFYPKSQISISLDVQVFCGSIFAKASQPFWVLKR